MKKTLSALTLICAIAAITTISSCTKTCDTGFEGSDCKTAMNTKFVGSYNVLDTAATHYTNPTRDSVFVYSYVLTVTASTTDPTALTFNNLGGYGAGTIVTGKVNASTTFTGNNATIGSVAISGFSGSISSNALSFVYTGIDANTTATSHAVGLK